MGEHLLEELADDNRPGDVRMRLGANIRRLRSDRGWRQADLAKITGLHRAYIGQVERGRRNVSVDNIERFARAFGIEPALLLEAHVLPTAVLLLKDNAGAPSAASDSTS